jgi:hypothetical protein
LHDSLTLNLFVNNINYTLEEYNIDDLNVTWEETFFAGKRSKSSTNL